MTGHRYPDSVAFGTFDQVHGVNIHTDPHFRDDGACLCFCKECSGPCGDGSVYEDCICPDCPCPVSKGRLS